MTNTNITRKYEITKTFTTGFLKGITVIETTSVRFKVGFSTKEYTITAVVVL
jgi:hypothetical protein